MWVIFNQLGLVMAKNKDLPDSYRKYVYSEYKQGSELDSSIARFYQNVQQNTFPSSSTSFTHDLPHAIPVHAVPDTTPQVIHHHHRDSGIPSWLFWWMLFSRNNNQPASQRHEEQRDSNFGAWMGAVILAGIVTLPAIAGIYYLLSEVVNNFERIYYNEGYLQAGLGLANIAGSLAIGTVLTNAYLASAIKAMCISAGFANPMNWAFFILGCTALFTAACVHYAIQEGIYRITARYNKTELNPEDPGRFRVTDDQLNDLIRADKANKKIKLDNVQNVITAIHSDMTENPSRMTRIFRYSPFFRSSEMGEKLSAIRTLRTTGKVNYQTELDNEQTLTFTTASLF